MTRGEAGKKLNTILETVEGLRQGLQQGGPRIRERLNVIQDQVMLLALDLGLPIQPVGEMKRREPDSDPAASAG